jgi:dTDP-4-dehydrorhamnose 3,5-epimerase
VTEYYSPKAERAVLWNDPDLGIDWKVLADDAIVSAKDQAGVPFAQAEVFD